MPINPAKAIEYLKKLKELNAIVKEQLANQVIKKDTKITYNALDAIDAIPYAKRPANTILNDALNAKKKFLSSPEMISRGGKDLSDERIKKLDETMTFVYDGDLGKFTQNNEGFMYDPTTKAPAGSTFTGEKLKYPVITLNIKGPRPVDTFSHELNHTFYNKINLVNPQELRLSKEGEGKQLTCPIPGYYKRNIEQEEDIHNVLQLMQELGVDINDAKQTSEAYDYLISLPEDLLTRHLKRTTFYNIDDVKKALNTFKSTIPFIVGTAGSTALIKNK